MHQKQPEEHSDWCIVEEIVVPGQEAAGEPPVPALVGRPRRDTRLPRRFEEFDLT